MQVTVNTDETIDVVNETTVEQGDWGTPEHFENEAAIDQEKSDIAFSIGDIDNFKQRRLDNLNQRDDHLDDIKTNL